MAAILLYRDYIILSILILLAQSSPPDLMYHREFIAHGEWWRIWTGHFTHSNITHLAMNLVGLWLFAFFQRSPITGMTFWGILFIFSSLISLLFWFSLPLLQWYVGFSGILYGLFALMAFNMLIKSQDALIALAILVLLIGKITIDMNNSGTSSSEQLIGVPVVHQAHLFGIITAAIIGIIQYIRKSHSIKIL